MEARRSRPNAGALGSEPISCMPRAWPCPWPVAGSVELKVSTGPVGVLLELPSPELHAVRVPVAAQDRAVVVLGPQPVGLGATDDLRGQRLARRGGELTEVVQLAGADAAVQVVLEHLCDVAAQV